jgi:ubiquinone/menaquinone biosynthesis C-methylase UbiE
MTRPAPDARLDAGGVRSAYRRIAPLYDIWGRLTESRAQDLCVRWIEFDTDALVIDVATGTGALLERILRAAPGMTVIGMDLTDAMLARAAAKTARYRGRCLLAQADAHRLPLPDRCADVLCNNYMFDLLPDSDFGPVLVEFLRVLRPGGTLALVNMTRPASAVQGFWEMLYRIHPPLLGGCRGVTMEPHVAAAGFRVLRRERISQLAFPSEVILARAPARRDEEAGAPG